MILDSIICQNTVKGWQLVGIIVTIIKILVPIIIIVTSMIPVFNALVKGTLDELTGSMKKIFMKIMAGIIVFFIPGIVNLAVSLLANKEMINEDVKICSECFSSPSGNYCKEKVDDYLQSLEEEKEKFKQDEISGSVDTSELKDGEKEESNGDSTNNGSVTVTGDGNTQAGDFRDIANAAYEGDKAAREKIIQVLVPGAQAAWKRDGYLPSVLIAQAIMESGWLKSRLAYDYNNVMSMNSDLNNSLWQTIDWDGTSTSIRVVHGGDDNTHYTYDEMRVYKSIEECFYDYSHFATTYKNGKYASIIGNKDPNYVIDTFMPGYTESASARDQVKKIINDYNLTRYDIDR